MVDKTYFHACKVMLGEGSMILPGNYGRIINKTGPVHPSYEREMALEHARANKHKDKPSRLESCFVCERWDAIRAYRDALAKDDVIYRVEIVAPEASRHRACFHCVQAIPSIGLTLEQAVEGYWNASLWFNMETAKGVECAEIVIASPIRVIERVG